MKGDDSNKRRNVLAEKAAAQVTPHHSSIPASMGYWEPGFSQYRY